ncbi:MAG: potassium-transporting ATPase subunit F [Cyanobium sp.]
MSVLMRSRFWLPLLITAGTLLLARLFRGSQPPLQSHALALLLSAALALSGYLFAVIAQPEKF